MHRNQQMVINTGPLISLIAAQQGLDFLNSLYTNIVVPKEVVDEIYEGGQSGFGIDEFDNCDFLKKQKNKTKLNPHLKNSLDIGEASVIQLAIDKKIDLVCIDEPVGRRIARLYDLKITGSIGILLRAIKEGHDISIIDAIKNMKSNGIYISEKLLNFAIQKAEKLN